MFFKQISDLKNARILICNDDGIDAEGIKILEEETSKICGDVWVAAPDVLLAVKVNVWAPRSACGGV